jgi:hypothetical protein
MDIEHKTIIFNCLKHTSNKSILAGMRDTLERVEYCPGSALEVQVSGLFAALETLEQREKEKTNG